MAKLTEAMKEMVANHQCYIATVDENGYPNIGPKRSTRVLDDSTLMFVEGTGKQTYRNLLANPKVAIAVADRSVLDGYRFVGTAEVLHEGELYEQAAAMAAQAGMPKPKAVVKVHVEAIYSLKPGRAGERID
ncbi:MAG TPA: pyridoxamine 5'-phosphate oxidase family protein [Clostridia bacterium]|nr:pyridoxamine 5'-phosphate oxidase family protein [Clostridia bacterium]